jgi:hypothetical protein
MRCRRPVACDHREWSMENGPECLSFPLEICQMKKPFKCGSPIDLTCVHHTGGGDCDKDNDGSCGYMPSLVSQESITIVKRDWRPPMVYVIGPFTANTNWEVQQNVQKAEQLAFKIMQLGAMPVCPHTNTRNFHGYQDAGFWYAGTARLFEFCDAGITVAGWMNSSGSRGEVRDANLRRQRLFHPANLDDETVFTNFEAWVSDFYSRQKCEPAR